RHRNGGRAPVPPPALLGARVSSRGDAHSLGRNRSLRCGSWRYALEPLPLDPLRALDPTRRSALLRGSACPANRPCSLARRCRVVPQRRFVLPSGLAVSLGWV